MSAEPAAPWKVRIALPDQVRRGEVFEIRTLIAHPMHSGFRRDSVGRLVERDILTSFVCRYNGQEVVRAELFPAIAANPYFSFFMRAERSGELQFTWTDQHGVSLQETRQLTVNGG